MGGTYISVLSPLLPQHLLDLSKFFLHFACCLFCDAFCFQWCLTPPRPIEAATAEDKKYNQYYK